MSGWEARKEAIRTKDAKVKRRILDDNRWATALVDRVMADLHDESQRKSRVVAFQPYQGDRTANSHHASQEPQNPL